MNNLSIRNRELIPLKGISSNVEFITFHGLSDGKEHIALKFSHWDGNSDPLVRIHSECMTGDIFHSLRCDCGEQLTEALSLMDKKGGILLYLRQEGRGIGLYNKIDSYQLQRSGMDTYQANIELGFPQDIRDFSIAAQMLYALDVKSIKLLSNNPEKKIQLEFHGISVSQLINTGTFLNEFNKDYLTTKKYKTNHILNV
ncbi:GTP cyclohydrolase-2 [Pectobacterium carotovorum subsp. carotovorum]|uniref:GTP cyclohydrolase-2 n=1 Tax=Pectobacterium polonicum TaxID=2485124 RepID=A0ABV1PF98_9GAMM|nr:GTP cyclohydrolase II [Pectobacterium polonicum]MDC9821105.1 GTP cyclohydrolase II [Pectobacterium polonicum]GKW26201.1 GTP cyclohydrolase-2 [Pectobacterium carotovorum subsp. carotovorum]